MLGTLYHNLLFQPIFNLLVLFYNVIPGRDIGLAIILLTLLIRFILAPLSLKGLKSQKELQQLQPKLKALQDQYKDKSQREQLARATMALYKEHKISPFSSMLPLIIQLPVLIALYQSFQAGFDTKALGPLLYSFIGNPGAISHLMFGVFDLSKPSIELAVAAGAATFIQGKLMMQFRPMAVTVTKPGEPNMQKMMQTQMIYFLPFFTVFISMSLPAALALYWLITTLFTVGQEFWLKYASINRG